jgi:hypothetical protein
MKMGKALGRGIPLLAAAIAGASGAACNELTGADSFVESACYPLPPSQCGEAGADATTEAAGDAWGSDAGMDSVVVNGDASDTSLDVGAADADAAPVDGPDDASEDGSGITDAQGDSEGGTIMPEAGCPLGDLSCGNVCVPNDTHNCGSCGHDCLGGQCSAGMCQPVTLAAAPGIASLTTDGTTVYWTAGSNVFSCAGSGCSGTPFTVTNKGPSKPAQILVAAGSAFWTSQGTFGGPIYSCPVSGCGSNAPLMVPKANSITYGFASDGQRLYWPFLSPDGGNVLPLFDCPLATIATCMPLLYASQSADVPLVSESEYSVASNGSSVVWLDQMGGSVSECAAGSSCNTVTTLASGRSNLTILAVDGARAYWFDSAGLSSCTLGGCASPKPIASDSGTSIASDGIHVYWTSGTSVMRANAAGSVDTVASSQPGASYVAVDSARVYWAVSTGWVMSVAK